MVLRRLPGILRRGEALEPVIPDNAVCPITGDDNEAALALLVAADPLAGTTPRFPGLAIDPDAVVLGALVLAASIERQTPDGDRKERMRRAIGNKLDVLRTTLELESIGPYRLLATFCEDWTEAEKTTLLIELVALDPFAPFQIDWADAHRAAGLAAIAELIGLTGADAQRVLNTFVDAARAHRELSMLRIGLYTVAGAAAIGSAGLLAAPMIGSALGAATGLGGAAATSHGLALIGGMGGTSSVTAGTWLVAQAGAVAGAVSGGAGSALFQLGAAQAQAELIKLQVAAKLVLVDLQRNDAAAHQVATELNARLTELEARIDEELLLNDPGSQRIKRLRRNAQALADASAWVDGHCADDDGSLQVSLAAAENDIERFIAALADQQVLGELNDDERASIVRDIDAGFRIKAGLDRTDVVVAVAAGITAAVIDAFGASTPKQSLITTELRKHAVEPHSWLAKAKVPFDQSIGDGFTPSTHRVLTPGHDPLLGLVFGTFDILNGTMTRTMVGGVTAVVPGPMAPADGVVRALMTEVAHLLSDVSTSAGLPLPGWTALTMSEATHDAAVAAYRRGYDTWHLPAMSLGVASVRAIVEGYTSLRSEEEGLQGGLDSQRVRAIELIAFGVSTSLDVAQLLAGANPLTANYVQWLTLARRIAVEAQARSASITDVLVDDLNANQLTLNRGWDLLVGDVVGSSEGVTPLT